MSLRRNYDNWLLRGAFSSWRGNPQYEWNAFLVCPFKWNPSCIFDGLFCCGWQRQVGPTEQPPLYSVPHGDFLTVCRWRNHIIGSVPVKLLLSRKKTSKENMLNCFKDCNIYIYIYIYIFTLRMVFWIWLEPSRWNCTQLEQSDVLCPSQPIPYLLMPWRHYEPGHQQAWSWPQKPDSVASTKTVNKSI